MTKPYANPDSSIFFLNHSSSYQYGRRFVYTIVLIVLIMNIEYEYTKTRSQFGSPCYYESDEPSIVVNVPPDKTLAEKYVLKDFLEKGTQESQMMSLSEMNTWRAEYRDRGIFHDQGGWPKDLNVADEEAVLRYRKKVEREDSYVASMKMLTKPVEHFILQNNAVNIYERYFDNVIKTDSSYEALTQIRNIYRDPKEEEEVRPVSHVSWSPDKGTAFAASYCNLNYHMRGSLENTEAYIWNVEISNHPKVVLDSKTPIVNLEWNSQEESLLVGGLYDGRIAVYDLRESSKHVQITTDVVSHRDPVHSVLWIHAKTGTEFFSTSADGVIKWWDCRNLKRVLDSIILDLSKSQNIVNAYGASCLEFDPGIPAKYLVGTETGHVICGNRKGVSLSEKLSWVMKTSTGPVLSLMRNSAFSKMFMTVAQWSVRIWSEECKESFVIGIKNYKCPLTCAEWSKTRYSVFFTTRSDGTLDIWDLLLSHNNALVSQKVSKNALTTLRMEESGQFVNVGDEVGSCVLIQLGKNLSTCEKNDKSNLSAMFDRENRREKILEGRMREIRLAMKLKMQQMGDAEDKDHVSASELSNRLTEILKAEETYWEEVNRYAAVHKEDVIKKEEEQEHVEPEADEFPLD